MSRFTLWFSERRYRMAVLLFLRWRLEQIRAGRPPDRRPFHPRPDCPALFVDLDGVPLDFNFERMRFPCGAQPGCGGPNCRWARMRDYPLPQPPEGCR